MSNEAWIFAAGLVSFALGYALGIYDAVSSINESVSLSGLL